MSLIYGAHAASTSSIPGGAMAAKFIFKNSYPDGSFKAYSGTGTTATPGSGHQATSVFNPDGSLLSSSNTKDNAAWPKWVKSLEIGISGATNTAAANANCARFAGATESTQKCCFRFTNSCDATEQFNCGTQSGLFRVSEKDCMSSTINDGTGGPNDGVYIRIVLDRSTTYLGASENIMAVVEYAAASLRPAPQDPTKCFVNGKFTPTNVGCSDFSWQLFLKHSTTEVVQPFMTMIPPTPFALKTNASNVSGAALIANSTVNAGGVASKQFVLPISRDSGLNTIQFSRITAMPTTTVIDKDGYTFANYCSVSNSPLCVGLVIYSITLYRM